MKVNTLAPNQITFSNNGRTFFQSYNSVIASIDSSGKIELDETYYSYSKTTVRFRNQFLGLTSKDVERMIKSGEIVLVNMN